MTLVESVANVEMAKAWDGEEGERWAQDADRYEGTGVNLWRAFLATGPITAGDAVLDIGCGNGKSTREAARLAAPGPVLGVDLSSQMLDVARQRAAAEGLANVRFLQADAQVHPFEEGRFDVAISSFGGMFFADPVAAFANIGRALRADGRLDMLAWRAMRENQWILVVRDALALGRSLGEPPVSAPGPFGLADPDHVRRVLTAAGFSEVGLTPVDEAVDLGPTDEAFAFVRRMGIVKGLTQDLDEPDRQRGLDAVHDALVAHEADGRVLLGAAAWRITARRR